MTTFLDQATLESSLTPESDVSFLGSPLKLSLSFSQEVPNHSFVPVMNVLAFSMPGLEWDSWVVLACFTFVPSPAFRLVSVMKTHIKDALWTKGHNVCSSLSWQDHSGPPGCPLILQVTHPAWNGLSLMSCRSYCYKASPRVPAVASDISFQAPHHFFLEWS